MTAHSVLDTAGASTADDRFLARRGFLQGGAAAVALAAIAGFGGGIADASAATALSSATSGAVRPRNTKFGLDISINGEKMSIGQKYRQVAKAYGGDLGAHMKFFSTSGWASANRQMTAMGWGRAAGERRPVFCAKQHRAAEFNELMTSRAKNRVIWTCFWQEVNDDIRDGHLSVRDYRATWMHMNALRKAHPNGHNVRFVPIMNGYVIEEQAAQAKAGHFDALTLLKGLPIDAVGYDLYNDSWMPRTWSAKKHLAPAAAVARALGKKWCVPEFGVQRSNKSAGDTDASAAQRLGAVIDYCKADPSFLWMNYWEGRGANGNWTLIGKPGHAVMSAGMSS